ncbi:MAG: GGDEF domain-containing protein [Peptostreptococcaceae bacterium]|nr:GGDEF domain-containing protein [Peptostreptococcaceae bacterium]
MEIKSKRIFKYIRLDVFLLLISIAMAIFAYREVADGSRFSHNISDVSANWRLSLDGDRFRKITTTVPYKYEDMQVIVLERKLTSCMINKGSLIFYTKDMGVAAFFDSYEIYRFGNESHVFNTKNYYGHKWNIVHIPEYAKQGDKIKLVLTPNYPLWRNKLPKMYSADDYDFAGFLLGKNQFAMVYSFGVFIFSLIAISYYFVNRRKSQIPDRILWIGVFALLSFAWFFSKNVWIQFVIKDEEVIKMISFTAGCLMCMPVLWTMYLIPDFKYKNSMMTMLLILSVYTILRLVLYFSIGFDVYQYADAEMIVKLFGGAILILLLILDYNESKNSSVGKMILPSFVLFFLISLDTFLHQIDPDRLSASLIELGMAISLLLMTLEAIREIKLAQRLSMWVEHYKAIAGIDIMTNLENQSAFLQQIETLTDIQKIGIIAIDVNNLKQINDSFGHAAGDRLLVALADVLREVFNEEYRKFRLGGDEFAILCSGKTEDELNQLIWEMDSKIHKYNSKNECPLEIATGVAVYDSRRDLKIKDLIDRADENMYLRKITMKIG